MHMSDCYIEGAIPVPVVSAIDHGIVHEKTFLVIFGAYLIKTVYGFEGPARLTYSDHHI